MKYTAAELWFKSLEKTGQSTSVLSRLLMRALEDEKQVNSEMAVDYRPLRDQAMDWMKGDFTSRAYGADPGIFAKSNESMGLVRSGIAFIVARTQEDLFGSTPWYSVIPEGNADGELADKLQKHSAWKLREAGYETMGERVVERIFNLGESILRTMWRKQTMRYHSMRAVLCEGKGEAQKPVLTTAGDYIYADDEQVKMIWQEDGSLAEVPDEPQEAAEGEEQSAPVPVPEGEEVIVFRKAPEVQFVEGRYFADWLIEEEETVYDGLDPAEIDYRNFRCSPRYKRIEDAPFRGHIYAMRLSQLKDKLLEIHGPEEEWDGDLRALVATASAQGGGAKDVAQTESGATSISGGDPKNPEIKCMDFEIEWDPCDGGDTRWFFGTLLVELQAMVLVDYLKNILPAGDSLYTAVSIYQPLNRWHGRGWWEIYSDLVTNSDRLWNELLFRESMHANPMTGVNWDAIEESREQVEFRAGMRVTLRNNKTMADFMQAFVFPNADRGTWQLLEFFMKLNQLETGVTSAAQGGLGDLPATNTATGIQSVLSSGSTLHKRPAKDIRTGLEENLMKSLTILYAQQDKDETFRYGEGQNAVLVTLTAEDVENLRVNVRILMTRFRQRELVENARAAIQVLTQYLSLPEQEKTTARPLFIQLLKGLDIQNAEEVIRQPIEVPPPSGPDPMAQIKVPYEDLPREAKVILLGKLGFDGVTPEMVDAQEKERLAELNAGAHRNGQPKVA